jgi:hypothetical protein
LYGYEIYGDKDEDDPAAASLADEELAEDDPYNFYYIMKDDVKKREREHQDPFYDDEWFSQRKSEPTLDSHSEETPFINENPDYRSPPERRRQVPRLDSRKPLTKQGQPHPLPIPRRGVLPIFIRHKLRYRTQPQRNYPIPLKRRVLQMQQQRPTHSSLFKMLSRLRAKVLHK